MNVINVIHIKSVWSIRLKKLKEEKVQIEIEMDLLRTQLDTKEKAIRDLEFNLSPY